MRSPGETRPVAVRSSLRSESFGCCRMSATRSRRRVGRDPRSAVGTAEGWVIGRSDRTMSVVSEATALSGSAARGFTARGERRKHGMDQGPHGVSVRHQKGHQSPSAVTAVTATEPCHLFRWDGPASYEAGSGCRSRATPEARPVVHWPPPPSDHEGLGRLSPDSCRPLAHTQEPKQRAIAGGPSVRRARTPPATLPLYAECSQAPNSAADSRSVRTRSTTASSRSRPRPTRTYAEGQRALRSLPVMGTGASTGAPMPHRGARDRGGPEPLVPRIRAIQRNSA